MLSAPFYPKLAELYSVLFPPQSLEATLQELTDKFDAAVKEKLFCQNQAEECAEKIDLADRLVNGLASENVRWKDSVLG